MKPSIKPEVHNDRNAASGRLSHDMGNTHKELAAMTGRVAPGMCSRKVRDRHAETHAQTDVLITILRSPNTGRAGFGGATAVRERVISAVFTPAKLAGFRS